MIRCWQVWTRAFAWRWLLVVALSLLPSMATAQVDYSAGKTPEQLFASDCSACHASPQSVGRDRDARALTAFLRQHYTTKAQWAALIANYLVRVRDEPPTTPTAQAPAAKDNEREAKSAPETLAGKLRSYATAGEEAKPPAPAPNN
jgi:hypothetical protein